MADYLKIHRIPEADFQYYLKRSTNTTFPETEENEDYREYLKWLAEGNTPDIEPAPAPLPRKWSKLLIRRQLRALNKETTFDGVLALNNFTAFWTDAEYISEDYPEVQQLLPALPDALGLTQEKIDEILANSIIN